MTKDAPQPIGPYSQAVEVNGFIFISGQIAINPSTNKLVEEGDNKTEIKMVMENLKAILADTN